MSFWNKKSDTPATSFPSGLPSGPSSAQPPEQSQPVRSASPATEKREGAPSFSIESTTASSSPSKTREEVIFEKYGKIRSALGQGTVISGKLSFDTVVSIDGKLSGEIFSSKALLIGSSGIVDAQIEVAALIVKGVVRGNIKATERIEVLAGGQLLGDIVTPVLVMEDGCVFSGNCAMDSSQKVVSAKSTDKLPEKNLKTASQEKAPSKENPAPAERTVEGDTAPLH